eukprot:GHVP01018804.1.p1 GENE.GHVP01018804.1~~GHVP01018804.1.p1  ORF type:complete len:118 (-),score=5.59 GHVP01018804.1:123-476(-)
MNTFPNHLPKTEFLSKPAMITKTNSIEFNACQIKRSESCLPKCVLRSSRTRVVQSYDFIGSIFLICHTNISYQYKIWHPGKETNQFAVLRKAKTLLHRCLKFSSTFILKRNLLVLCR